MSSVQTKFGKYTLDERDAELVKLCEAAQRDLHSKLADLYGEPVGYILVVVPPFKPGDDAGGVSVFSNLTNESVATYAKQIGASKRADFFNDPREFVASPPAA
jgi:hypothetical protein